MAERRTWVSSVSHTPTLAQRTAYRLRRVLSSASNPYVYEAGWVRPEPASEAALIVAVNAHRKTLGLSQLLPYPGLVADAEWKAGDQAFYAYEDHNQPPGSVPGLPAGSTVYDRFGAFGFGASAWGENIAYGYTDIPSVMAAWLSDVGHKANLENTSWTHIGCGVVTRPADAADPENLTWWVQDFAALTGAPPPPPPVTPPPAAGTQWRPKLNPLAKPITVIAGAPVTYENRKGVVGHLALAAFLKKYRQA